MTVFSVDQIAPSSGEFFSLSKYGNSEAIVFVPRAMKEGLPNKFNPDKPRTGVVGDFYLFPDVASMVGKRPETMLGALSTDTALVRISPDCLGGVVGPFRAEKITTKKGNPAWVLHTLVDGNKGTAECKALAEELDAQLSASDDDVEFPEF